MKLELDYIQELVKLLEDSSLTEISLADGEKSISLKKEKEIVTSAAIPQLLTATNTSTSAPESFVCTPVEVKKGKPITSPMVGTFYSSASPDSKPFVELGSTVSSGSTVCIIEAMKLMNEIESDVSGKVTEICVSDGQAIEFGQVLMYVE